MGTTRLYSTSSVEEQWQSVAGPWLVEMAGAAWRNPLPTVVLTPSRAESFYLRSRMVEKGVPFLGLRFWTPSDARKFLVGKFTPEASEATQAELRLVARASSENLLEEAAVITGPASTRGTWTSVAQDPGPFLRAYDLLLGAGWEPKRTCAAYGRALARQFEVELEVNGITTQAGMHRLLRELAVRQKASQIAHLLVVGFNAAHWPLWDLLQATVSIAEESVVGLSQPRVFAGDIDRLWIGSWEQMARGEALTPEGPLEKIEDGPFELLAASYEDGTVSQLEKYDLTFLVTPDLASQARAIALRAVEHLRRDTCTRLGIVFAEANALALEVAGHLRQLGIPLDDGTGLIQPGIFERRCWLSWVALQEEPTVQRLVAWLRACEASGVSFARQNVELSAREIADVLENALGESLVDDLHYLILHLEESSGGRRAEIVADFLRNRSELPESATFAEFLDATREAMALPGWEEYLVCLQIDPPPWLIKNGRILSRRVFLGWLKEATDSRERTRGTGGNHFYGKVHLLIYSQMTGQTWSHLILTGLNDGVWPRVYEAEAFGSRHELAALNQEARGLNKLGTEQGRQGEGHESVQAGRGHCLLPLERQDLALRDLCSALEGTSEAVCLTAMTTEAGRSLLPSDFFNHAYQAGTGQELDEDLFRQLANTTLEWCHRGERLLLPAQAADRSGFEIAPARIAYEARRDGTNPFGPYEFAFKEPPAQPIQLSCKKWETAWHHPAAIWLEDVVGVAPWPEGTLSWSRAVGTWVHRWMKSALQTCRERNSTEDFSALLREAADREAQRVHSRAHAAGIELYPWWSHVWGQARSMTLGLGETLAPHLPGWEFRSEFTLPENLFVALPGTERDDFRLKGRIDLLLIKTDEARSNAAGNDFSGCASWVIDFKTGSARALSEKRIIKGTGLQAVLYALAVRAQGASTIALSLLTYDAPLKMQVYLDQVVEIQELFHSLDIFHRDGIFGMRGDAQTDYGFAPVYPIATRFVPPSVLEAKWALVHGSSISSGEDDE